MSDYKHINVSNGVINLKQEDRVISILQDCSGTVFICENCDDHFNAQYSKGDAIAAFKEIISAIENGDLL